GPINLASHILADRKEIDLLEVVVSLRLAQAVVEDDLAVEPLLVETERCGGEVAGWFGAESISNTSPRHGGNVVSLVKDEVTEVGCKGFQFVVVQLGQRGRRRNSDIGSFNGLRVDCSIATIDAMDDR